MKTTLDLLTNFYYNQNDLFLLLFQKHYVLPIELFNKKLIEFLLSLNLIEISKSDLNIQATIKINYTQGVFLYTDFIDETNSRVFPFTDEGNIQHFSFKKDYPKFKTKDSIKVWDMCTGCGHPLILLEQEFRKVCNNVEVIGTDINERAIEYCKKNIQLNNSKAKVILSDFDSNLDSFTKFDYIWCNPPFGLSPQKDSLHTYGGQYGLDKTIKSLEVIKKRLAPNGIAQLLSYSIGNSNSLLIEDYIKEILPDFKYEISFLKDQKIWRFHGVKSCLNPMPIGYISMRSTDKYYNLLDIPKSSWLNLIQKIKELGYTHLYMVLITISYD